MRMLPLALLAAGAPAVAADDVLITAERVIVQPGEELENAQVLVRDGRIVAVGAELELPADVDSDALQRIEGSVVCAGFVDAWSTLGLDAQTVEDQGTGPATRTVDALDPWLDAHLRHEAVGTGVTSARVQGATSARVGGFGCFVRLGALDGSAGGVLLDDACMQATAGIERGNRAVDIFERPSEVDRIGAVLEAGRAYRETWLEYGYDLAAWEEEVAELEEELEKDFKKKKKERDKEIEEAEEEGDEFKEERYRDDPKKPKAPRFNADDEAMARVVHGEVPLIVEVHRAEEIRRLLQVTSGYGRLRLVVAGGSQAHLVADELAERGVPVIVFPEPAGASARRAPLDLAGELADAGVTVLFGSGGRDARVARDLPTLVSLAIGHGLDPEAALRGLTIDAATALDVADRIGSVRRGRDADLLVLSGDPLSTTTRIEYVLTGGRVAAQR